MADARTALARRLAGVSMPSTMEGFGVDPAEIERQGSYDAESGAELARMLGATGATAVDPLGIPSAITGMVSPDARDSWRAYQASEGPIPQIVGSLIGGYGGMTAAAKGARGVADLVGRTASAAAGSDVIDAAAGKEGAISRQTLAKAMLGPVGAVPGRATNVALGAAGGGLLMSGSEAKASDEIARLQQELRDLNKQRIELQTTNIKGQSKASADASRARMDKAIGDQIDAINKRLTAAETLSASRAKEKSDRKAAEETEAGGRAQAAYDKAMSEKSPSYKETWWGRNVNPGLAPLITGMLTGAVTGGKTARAQRASTEAWERALANAGRMDVAPSARLASQAEAAAIKTTMPADASPFKGYGLPVAAGGVEGAGSTGIAQLWDRNLPDENPERMALAAALAELPQGHPDRARYESRMNDPTLSTRNPAKVAAESRSAGDLALEAGTRAGVGVMGGVLGKTAAGLAAPSAQTIGRLRALTPDSIPQITPETVVKEATRMGGVRQADEAFRGEQQLLDQQRQLADAATQLEREALAGIVAKGAPKEVQQAVRRKLAEVLAGQPQPQRLPPPPPATGSNPPPPSPPPAPVTPSGNNNPAPIPDQPKGVPRYWDESAGAGGRSQADIIRADMLDYAGRTGNLKTGTGHYTEPMMMAALERAGVQRPIGRGQIGNRSRELTAAGEAELGPNWRNAVTRDDLARLLASNKGGTTLAVPVMAGAAGAAAMDDGEPEMSPEQRARMILARQMAGASAF